MTEGGGDGERRDASAPTIAIVPSMPVYREILLLAAAWNVTPAETLGRLVDHYYLTHLGRRTGAVEVGASDIAVHRVYMGRRIEAVYHRPTSGVTVLSEPLTGRVYRSPSGARAAVVAALNPGVAPNGSGWDFWIVTATGKALRSIRFDT